MKSQKTVGITVKLEGVKAIISISLVNDDFCLVPDITINKIDIDENGAIPYPVDQIFDAVIDEFASGPAKQEIEKELE
ncbi:hypothetical protein [Paenibacillus sp. XY044]|uniref:hypothetical protein n=1 Tax=Paenibacillus sp. XY044 TaxID=2026089 RepID=UPI000B996640|nr:hypothetical protein [Paenibacillus sp. XY044]OZB92127.1 hypothetical protein CJP46_24600 [Paenibacillus sp. XY044]